MRCPLCGADVEKGADVCPNCHVYLKHALHGEGERERWCTSCGCPIPADLDACPQCGMPVAGAFDEDAQEPTRAFDRMKDKLGDTGLISAIPGAPLDGNEASGAKDHNFVRQIVIASLAAILLVGGTALYITRPWDPNAYVIHATQDADTSAEGNIAPVSHLSSQDTSENKKQEANAAAAANALETYKQDLATYSQRADELRERLNKQLTTNDTATVEQGDRDAASLRNEFATRTAEMQQLELYSQDLVSLRESLTLLSGYLQGELDVLADAWATAVRLKGTREWNGSVRSVLAGENSEYSYNAWHELFANAYATM